MQLSKSALARHLSDWHGNQRNITPISELSRWSWDDLRAEHQRLCELGSCTMGMAS